MMFEAWNEFAALMHARTRQTPAKAWWDAEAMHPAIFRALKIDPADHGAVYAVHPFRLHRNEDGRAVILAAYPAPRLMAAADEDWLGIETVIQWNPVTNTASVAGDPVPQLVGGLSDEANVVFADPLAFFQGWAVGRAMFAVQRQKASAERWHAIPAEREPLPGALMIGDPDLIRWNPASLPAHIEVAGAEPKAINRAIFRAARLPRVTNSTRHAA